MLRNQGELFVHLHSANAYELNQVLSQNCVYEKTPYGVFLSPKQKGRWLSLFCEISFPSTDNCADRLNSFVQQILQEGAFYRPHEDTWIRLERIQVLCTSNLLPEAKELDHQFLSRVSTIYVPYPREVSLKQLYGTLNRAMLTIAPSLLKHAESLTTEMVELYLMSQERFTQDFSKTKLTDWVRQIRDNLSQVEAPSVEGLIDGVIDAGQVFNENVSSEESQTWIREAIEKLCKKYLLDDKEECHFQECLDEEKEEKVDSPRSDIESLIKLEPEMSSASTSSDPKLPAKEPTLEQDSPLTMEKPTSKFESNSKQPQQQPDCRVQQVDTSPNLESVLNSNSAQTQFVSRSSASTSLPAPYYTFFCGTN